MAGWASVEERWPRGGEQKRKGAKKRPSVETEGRLTIACHMKNLQKIDVDVSLNSICLFPYLLPAVTKIMTRRYIEKN